MNIFSALTSLVTNTPTAVTILNYSDNCEAQMPTVAMARDALAIARRFDGGAEQRGATLFFFDPYGSARSAMQYELNITFVEKSQAGDGFTSW
jgi:hypothetical protein